MVSVVCELPDEAEAECEDDDAWDEAAECEDDDAWDEAAECAAGFEEAAWLEAAEEAAASDEDTLASPLSALLSASSEDASGSSSGCDSGSLVESAALAALDTGTSACASELLAAALATVSSVESAFVMCSASGTATTRSSATAAINCFVCFCIFYQTLPSPEISRRKLQSVSSIPFCTPEHNP